jgi:hypothetical protein
MYHEVIKCNFGERLYCRQRERGGRQGETSVRRKIRLIESKAKRRHLKNFTCKGTLRQVFICLRPLLLLGFCLGRSGNFVGFESGQIQYVKFLQNMVSNRTQRPHSLPVTHCLYIVNIDLGKGGGDEPERRLEG